MKADPAQRQTPQRVLVIEDEAGDFVLIRSMLTENTETARTIQWAQSYGDALRVIETAAHDIYLIDLQLGHPDDNGLRLLRIIRHLHPDAIAIIISGRGDRRMDVEAIQEGASDYLAKGEFNAALLERSIRYSAERTRAMKTIHESRERLQDFLDNASDLIHSIDLEGRLLFVNRAWRETLKYEDDDLASLRLPEIIHPDYSLPHLQLMREMIEGQHSGGQIIETVFIARDGSLVHLEGSINCRFEDARPVALRGIFRNVTEIQDLRLRDLELQMQREKDERLREMVMNLSHDLRTPLSILNTTRYLMEKNGTSENRESYLGTMQQQLDHLRLLATKLLTVARLKDPPAMTLEDTNLSEVVAAAVGRLSEGFRQKRIGLDVQLEDRGVDAPADRFELDRALSAIIENALEYTDPGGRVIIQTRQMGSAYLIAVEDTGQGIAAADLPHIFEQFYRADSSRNARDHAGLGLAIARHLIESMGGGISVESTPGIGSRFVIQFPIRADAAASRRR
ncbi:MAG: PAS domain S-box protein [Chloroflexi bacterium]|nr:PAS domain S-box protein [Chloroflexota bacterium]